LVDSISRDKNIDKDQLFGDLEAAMASAIRKTYGESEDVAVEIDRLTGAISAIYEQQPISMVELGRISAQTCKQVMIQKIREAERNSIFDEFSERVGTIVTGTVSRFEGGAMLINLGRTDAVLPRSEQIPGESHHPGDRVRGMILDVRESPHQVKIVLTRTHPDYIRRLFELEVPEVSERIIEIKALAREAGYRTKVAVASIDSKVDAVGACVGVRGSRIRNIVDELGGEKIDIVRWNESSQVLIANALKPAEVQEIALCFELGRCSVVVADDQLSLAIGKRGQNVRLAARLTGWDIDILTPTEYNKSLDDLEKSLKSIGVEDVVLDKLVALGMVSLLDVEEVGAEPLVKELEIDEELAAKIVEQAGIDARRIAAEKAEAKKREQELATQAAEAAKEAPPVEEAVTDAADESADKGASMEEPGAEAESAPVDAELSEEGDAASQAETAAAEVTSEQNDEHADVESADESLTESDTTRVYE
jgi:N utilization substance protein A